MRGDLALEFVAGARIEIQRVFRVGNDQLQCVGIRREGTHEPRFDVRQQCRQLAAGQLDRQMATVVVQRVVAGV